MIFMMRFRFLTKTKFLVLFHNGNSKFRFIVEENYKAGKPDN